MVIYYPQLPGCGSPSALEECRAAARRQHNRDLMKQVKSATSKYVVTR